MTEMSGFFGGMAGQYAGPRRRSNAGLLKFKCVARDRRGRSSSGRGFEPPTRANSHRVLEKIVASLEPNNK
jgi:hypothetical protein